MYTKDDLCFNVSSGETKKMLGYISVSDNANTIIGYPEKYPEGVLINTVSNKYKLTPVEEHLNSVENAITECFGTAFNAKYDMINFSKFYVEYLLADPLQFEVDQLLPVLRLQHSYNGKLKTSLEIAIHRVFCENGATTLERVDSSLSYKNTIGNRDALNSFVCSSLKQLNKSNTLKVYQELADRSVPDFAGRILEVALATKFPVRQIEMVNERLATEASAFNVAPNDWLIYNSFNYQLNHNDEIKMHDEFKFDLDHRLLNYMYKNQ